MSYAHGRLDKMKPEIKAMIEHKFLFRIQLRYKHNSVYMYMLGYLDALQEVGLITLPEWNTAKKNLKEWRDEGE